MTTGQLHIKIEPSRHSRRKLIYGLFSQTILLSMMPLSSSKERSHFAMQWRLQSVPSAQSNFAVELASDCCVLRVLGATMSSRLFKFENGRYSYEFSAQKDMMPHVGYPGGHIDDPNFKSKSLGPICMVTHSKLPHAPWPSGEAKAVADCIKDGLKFLSRHHPDPNRYFPIDSILFAPPPFCHLTKFSDPV